MLFNSTEFLLFFPLMVVGYYLLPGKYRWIWLLAGSYFFYMSWNAGYILLILTSTLVDYFAAKRIFKTTQNHKKKRWLWLSLIANLGLLITFKYFNFFSTNLFALIGWVTDVQPTPLLLNVLLPVGISFYTFQTISYTLDVYYGRIEPEKHLGKFALYVSFFPQLVAGPIERAGHLLPQLKKEHQLKYENIAQGFKQMVWGFFKKVVIADNIAILVDTAYNDPTSQSGIVLLFTTLLFGFQIYCDFSGYSDIAIGAARMMGINLMVNFRRPFFSQSVREFWSRWHISLYTWLNDYVYNPIALRFRNIGKNGIIAAVLFTFLISGLWHGANWNFIVWGLLHGIGVVAVLLYPPPKAKTKYRRAINMILVFLFLQFTWVLFRANSLADAGSIFSSIFTGSYAMADLHFYFLAFPTGKTIMTLAFLLLFILSDNYLDKLIKQEHSINYKTVSYFLFGFLISCIFLFGYWGKVQFIYFQF